MALQPRTNRKLFLGKLIKHVFGVCLLKSPQIMLFCDFYSKEKVWFPTRNHLFLGNSWLSSPQLSSSWENVVFLTQYQFLLGISRCWLIPGVCFPPQFVVCARWKRVANKVPLSSTIITIGVRNWLA